MDLTSIQCFIAVAETGSFTKAARSVGCTQSAVSQQVSKLESRFGCSLLRRGKDVALKSEGEIFLGYARRMFALQQEAVDRLSHNELVGEIRFGIPDDFASVYLSDILVDFSRLHPRIFLNVETDLTANLYQRFKAHEFDLVLLKMNKTHDFPNGVDVWSEPLRWVGPRSYPNWEMPVPLVLSPSPCVYRARALDALESVSIRWRIVFTSSSYASMTAAVRAGMGLTVLPSTMIPDGLSPVTNPILPELPHNHVSLLKHDRNNSAINSLEMFVLNKLK
jgi:DNA-binding transcriptional LysR family regulator